MLVKVQFVLKIDGSSIRHRGEAEVDRAAQLLGRWLYEVVHSIWLDGEDHLASLTPERILIGALARCDDDDLEHVPKCAIMAARVAEKAYSAIELDANSET